MKIICAPDSYKESLSAVAAANAMADGIRQTLPDALVDCCPVGDGGEGTLEVLLAAADGVSVTVEVSDPFGEDLNTEFGLFNNGKQAFVESAKCIGLQLVPSDRRNPEETTSFGVGELIMQAIDAGARDIVVGIGGSSTNDGGCGMAQALGYRFFDSNDQLIVEPISGGILSQLRHIDPNFKVSIPDDVSIRVASDVTNTLLGPDGASNVYGPQKGASAEQVKALDDGLRHLSELWQSDLGINVAEIPGAGAAGGLGAGLIAFTGARMVSGIDYVLETIRFRERVGDCNLCVTGEGKLDRQSISGKACMGVAKMSSLHDVPTIAVVGSLGEGYEQCLDAGLDRYIEFGADLPLDQSMQRATELITAVSATEIAKLA